MTQERTCIGWLLTVRIHYQNDRWRQEESTTYSMYLSQVHTPFMQNEPNSQLRISDCGLRIVQNEPNFGHGASGTRANVQNKPNSGPAGGWDTPGFHYSIIPPSRSDDDRAKRTQFGGVKCAKRTQFPGGARRHGATGARDAGQMCKTNPIRGSPADIRGSSVQNEANSGGVGRDVGSSPRPSTLRPRRRSGGLCKTKPIWGESLRCKVPSVMSSGDGRANSLCTSARDDSSIVPAEVGFLYGIMYGCQLT